MANGAQNEVSTARYPRSHPSVHSPGCAEGGPLSHGEGNRAAKPTQTRNHLLFGVLRKSVQLFHYLCACEVGFLRDPTAAESSVPRRAACWLAHRALPSPCLLSSRSLQGGACCPHLLGVSEDTPESSGQTRLQHVRTDAIRTPGQESRAL